MIDTEDVPIFGYDKGQLQLKEICKQSSSLFWPWSLLKEIVKGKITNFLNEKKELCKQMDYNLQKLKYYAQIRSTTQQFQKRKKKEVGYLGSKYCKSVVILRFVMYTLPCILIGKPMMKG